MEEKYNIPAGSQTTKRAGTNKIVKYARKILRRLLYESAAFYALKKRETQRFMNLGYQGSPLELSPGDAADKLHFQLYNAICTGVPFAGKSVLEIGCGRGGGCYFFKKYLAAAEVTGVDVSHYNISIATKTLMGEGIKFLKQHAEKLSLPKESFEIIVNLESSHCYSDRRSFYKGVYALLKPNGYFIYADILNKKNISKMVEYITGLGFVIEKENNLTEGVMQSMQERPVKRFGFFKRRIVPLFLKSFYFTTQSKEYNLFLKGEKVYFSFVFVKK